MHQSDLEKIFLEAFEAYSDAIFRFCIVKVSNKELAEDFTQEVFSRYWLALRDGKEMSNTRAYLYTIAHNLAKDWYKKKKSESLDMRMERGEEPGSTKENPEKDAEYRELFDAISDMEEHDKEVLLLRYVEGLDPKDIAAILGETANAISVRINRAHTKLQKRLHL